jgi:hypothetical protein
MSRTVDISCSITARGKIGARSSGVTGCLVPGCSTGARGSGRSALMLYQWVGRCSSSSRYFTLSLMVLFFSSGVAAAAPV